MHPCVGLIGAVPVNWFQRNFTHWPVCRPWFTFVTVTWGKTAIDGHHLCYYTRVESVGVFQEFQQLHLQMVEFSLKTRRIPSHSGCFAVFWRSRDRIFTSLNMTSIRNLRGITAVISEDIVFQKRHQKMLLLFFFFVFISFARLNLNIASEWISNLAALAI